MMKKKLQLSLLAALFFVTPLAQAEELDKVFGKVKEYADAGNFPKAITELGWAQKELEKRHFAKLESLLPAQIAGFKGQDAQSQSAMGITSVERTYTKGNEQIRLSLAGGGASGPLGGFAALGQMAGMMGTQPGVDTFRLEGRTANLQTRNNRAELTVFLESGSMLKLEQRNATDGATLKQAAEDLKADIVKLDQYLKGAN